MKNKTSKNRKGNQRGFTLMELTVSVSTIALLLAIAMPTFTRMRIGANEASAQKALLAYRNAFINYQLDSGTFAFPNLLSDLGDRVDSSLASDTARRGGYTFTLSNAGAASYTITATPVVVGNSGTQEFTITEGGTVSAAPANPFSGIENANLQDDFTRLRNWDSSNPKYSRDLVTKWDGAKYSKDGEYTVREYNRSIKNVTDRTLNFIMAVVNPKFGGGWLAAGAKVVGDALVKASSTSDTKYSYVKMQLKAGETKTMTETWKYNTQDYKDYRALPADQKQTTFYSRSIKYYEFTPGT